MSLTSLNYISFLIFVTVTYFLIPPKTQKLHLLIFSYIFCGFFGTECIVIIFLYSILNFYFGIILKRLESEKYRKSFFSVCIIVNLSALLVYKYSIFIINNLSLITQTSISHSLNIPINIVAPVGISFYTFQSISYLIDIYKKKILPEHSFLDFALSINFFPKLIAGPIERATTLLPQFSSAKIFDYERIRSGLVLILWGYFQKIVIADRLAVYVNAVYNTPQSSFGLSIWLATLFFTFQIYCDFNGYIDIARGFSKVLGFKLSRNFQQPYLAISIRDFWKRWHISLSSWLRDYLYIPLGGNRVSLIKKYRNILIVFILCGFWHGPSWTFIIWGTLHGVYLVSELAITNASIKRTKILPSKGRQVTVNILKIFSTFFLVSIGWLFFRANSVNDAFVLIKNGMILNNMSVQVQDGLSTDQILLSFILIFFVMIIDFLQSKYSLQDILFKQPLVIRWVIYMLLIYSIILLPASNDIAQFIYFRF